MEKFEFTTIIKEKHKIKWTSCYICILERDKKKGVCFVKCAKEREREKKNVARWGAHSVYITELAHFAPSGYRHLMHMHVNK